MAFARVAPAAAGRRLLDAGCGTGRRLPEATARGGSAEGGGGAPALTVGVDLAWRMLRRARTYLAGAHPGPGGAAGPTAPPPALARADLAALPFVSGAFDLIWCRLTLGFLPSLREPLGEMARVLRRGGELVLTDLHPEALDTDGVRSFRDEAGALLAVAHRIHAVDAVLAACGRAGLEAAERYDLDVRPALLPLFPGPEGEKIHARLLDRPVVLALRLVRR